MAGKSAGALRGILGVARTGHPTNQRPSAVDPNCTAIPPGGWFTCEHDPGNRIWYIDPAGIIHRWINGSSANNFRVGDGQWFYDHPATPKVSRVRSVMPESHRMVIPAWRN